MRPLERTDSLFEKKFLYLFKKFFMFKEKISHACQEKVNFTNENSSLLLPGKKDFSNKEFLV